MSLSIGLWRGVGGMRFYDEHQLARLGREAGFSRVSVERHSLEPFAREAGVPEEHLPCSPVPDRSS
jgi:hypothetical protein